MAGLLHKSNSVTESKMTQEFYSLSFNSNNVELFVEVIGEYDDIKLKTGEFIPDILKVKKSQGRKAYEVVRLQDVFNFLISEKVKTALLDSELTGWKTYEIDSGKLLNGYTGFQCIGKCGIIEASKESEQFVGKCLDVDAWDGSDFFILETTMMIICTEKAKEVLEKFNIKNIELKNVMSYDWS